MNVPASNASCTKLLGCSCPSPFIWKQMNTLCRPLGALDNKFLLNYTANLPARTRRTCQDLEGSGSLLHFPGRVVDSGNSPQKALLWIAMFAFLRLGSHVSASGRKNVDWSCVCEAPFAPLETLQRGELRRRVFFF